MKSLSQNERKVMKNISLCHHFYFRIKKFCEGQYSKDAGVLKRISPVCPDPYAMALLNWTVDFRRQQEPCQAPKLGQAHLKGKKKSLNNLKLQVMKLLLQVMAFKFLCRSLVQSSCNPDGPFQATILKPFRGPR
jgi:hypothetical protein